MVFSPACAMPPREGRLSARRRAPHERFPASVSLPTARRKSEDDTVPSEPSVLVCPRCKEKWPESTAPAKCPKDDVALVRPRDLVDDDPMVGRTLEGRYTILAKLGAGSMG